MHSPRTRWNRRTFTVMLAFALLTPGVGWAATLQQLHASGGFGVESQLRYLEQVFSDAFNNRDAATLDLLLAEDFLLTDEEGNVSTKSEYLDFVVNHIRVLSGGIGDLVIRVYGDTAIVVGRFDGVTVVDGEEAPDSFRFTDVWLRRFDRWYVIASQNSPIRGP